MKKSLIALAVMAAAGAASAQSSVQLYGIADIYFSSTSTKLNGTKLDSQVGLEDGGIDGSRFGLKGSEDLGNGLKVNFQLEQGFSLDTGNDAVTHDAFSREAWVGLSGGFGEVRLGKTFSAFDDVSATSATVFDSVLTPMNKVFVSNWAADTFDNTVKYITPEFGGFSASASYSFGEDKVQNGKDASNIYALGGKYANGPLVLAAGYAKYDNGYDDGVSDFTQDAVRLAGSYDFGVVKALASYGSAKFESVGTEEKAREWELGADIPLSSNLVLSAGYARSTGKVNGVKETKDTSFGLAVAYSLSKRTTAYAGLNQAKYKDLLTSDEVKDTIYAVGIKHNF